MSDSESERKDTNELQHTDQIGSAHATPIFTHYSLMRSVKRHGFSSLLRYRYASLHTMTEQSLFNERCLISGRSAPMDTIQKNWSSGAVLIFT
ncbi:hypothetical protein ACG9X1_17220, partial [Acinetobacter baumannii]|uniref:hypothetical protein n=1 Tax=Acinetobacter baumannii TaxID=470 RepID=UPI003AF5A1EC